LSEPAQVRACEAIAVDAPLAPQLRALPPRAEIEAALVAAVQAALAEHRLPVVLAPIFGAALEAATLLHEAGVRLRVHGRISALWQAYAHLGIATPPHGVARFRGSAHRGEALLWPLEARHAAGLSRLQKTRLILAGSAALEPDAAARFAVELALPLADHGDLPSLLSHARAAEARDLYFTRGLSDEVASACAAAGLRAHALAPPRAMQQMALFA
jgi:hypothetical protein